MHAHADITSGVRGLTFGPNSDLHPYFCILDQGRLKSAHLQRLARILKMCGLQV